MWGSVQVICAGYEEEMERFFDSNPGFKPLGCSVRGAPPILEPILVGIGMFTGGTIWVLTHGQLNGVWLKFMHPGKVAFCFQVKFHLPKRPEGGGKGQRSLYPF